MDDKTPPAGSVEAEATEDKAMHEADVQKFAELKAKIDNATPDDDLPHVQSEQSTL